MIVINLVQKKSNKRLLESMAYKLPHLSREEIKKMLALNEVELKQTRFYQEVSAEGKQEGR